MFYIYNQQRVFKIETDKEILEPQIRTCSENVTQQFTSETSTQVLERLHTMALYTGRPRWLWEIVLALMVSRMALCVVLI